MPDPQAVERWPGQPDGHTVPVVLSSSASNPPNGDLPAAAERAEFNLMITTDQRKALNPFDQVSPR